jgi:hypothetical protein
MNKTALKLIAVSLTVFFVISPGQGWSQDKKRHQNKPSLDESVTIIRDKSGAVTKLTKSLDMEEDLSPEPKTYIQLRMEIIEIRPSETKLISSPIVKVENGKSGWVIQGRMDAKLSIEVTPTVITGKGIELKVSFKKEPEMKSPKEQTVMTPNSQPVVIELLENIKANTKLAVKITPWVEIWEGAKEYPDDLNELQFVRSFLIMNNDKLIAKGGLSVKNADGGIVPYFSVEGRGVFVLSFKPFEGAEAKGLVSGKIMRIKISEDEFEWFSEEPILPEGLWLVWVRNNPSLKPSEAEKGFLCFDTKNGSAGILFGKDAWKTFFK